MEEALKNFHEATNTAYVIFCFIMGVYAAFFAARNVPISGNFWGAMWTNTALAAIPLLIALILLLVYDAHPKRDVYYLYAIYFVISLPGVFAIMRGSDNRRAAIFFSIVAFFNAGAAYRAGTELVIPWS